MATERPTAIGMIVQIDSLESADAALHELGWLRHQQDAIAAQCKQEIEAVKLKYARRLVVPIGEQAGQPVLVAIADRMEALLKPLAEWTSANIAQHLAGKKTKILAHGKLGLRQQPRVVEIDKDEDGTEYTVEQVLAWIRESELRKAQKAAITETKLTLHLKGAKDAYDTGKITTEDLASIGLVVREAHDAPVVEPAKIAVTAE